jgi:hypothetical protein
MMPLFSSREGALTLTYDPKAGIAMDFDALVAVRTVFVCDVFHFHFHTHSRIGTNI